jgi:hypothetical protein
MQVITEEEDLCHADSQNEVDSVKIMERLSLALTELNNHKLLPYEVLHSQ